MSSEKKHRLLEQAGKIIAELKRLGVWETAEAQMQGSFLGQLRYGMIPGIEARLAGEHPLPAESNLGVFAVREFDGQSEFDTLTELLSEFDLMYEKSE